MAITLENLIGSQGVYFFEATTAHTALTSKNIRSIWINADAVFSTLTDEDDNNIITQSNLTGRTIGKGALIGCKGNKRFKAITLTSGSAIGIIGG